MAQERVLFRSDQLLARWRGGFGSAQCVVTFSSYSYEQSADREGFGETFLAASQIDAIHVTTRDNRWYDLPEIAELLAAIAQETARYGGAVTYGSSMGGFAALHFAGHVGADIAIAISPQFAIDRAHAPFETRWRRDARGLRFPAVASRPAARQYVFFDPLHRIDAQHVACFRAAAPLQEVALRHGGHPVGAVLDETGMLKQAIHDILAGTFDPAACERSFRQRRRRSAQYLYALSVAVPPRRLPLKIALARMAVAQLRCTHCLSHLGALLTQTGQWDEAEALHLAAVETGPSDVHASLALAHHLERTGRRRAARDILVRLRRLHPRNPLVASRRARHSLGRIGLDGLYDAVTRLWTQAEKA